MDQVTLSQIAAMSGADLLAGNPDAIVLGVSHDTRTLKPGELYIALRGEHFHGNDFIKDALEKGAVGVLSDCAIADELPAHIGILRVDDALQGLTRLARAWREELSLRAILITGSNGKTSTKDFTHAVLKDFLHVTATQGNFNNHIGLPRSILKASRSDDVAVWEIGMNHRGEIAPLAALAKPAPKANAKPTIAIITNIGTAHIGFLGSRAAIAEEKGDLLATLSQNDLAILPAADDFCETLASRTTARILRVGIGVGELQATALTPREHGMEFQISYQGVSLPAFLPVMGVHMVQNALFAIAAGLECGLSLQQGIAALQKITPSQSRLSIQECRGITLVDDCYNANPDSMEAALKTIHAMPCRGRRIAVFGRMGELGDHEQEGYQRVGAAAASMVDILIAVGVETAPLVEAAHHHGLKAIHEKKNNQEAGDLLLSLIHPGDLVLIKGSHAANLKELVTRVAAPVFS